MTRGTQKKGKNGCCSVEIVVYCPSGIDEAFEVRVIQLSTVAKGEEYLK